MVKNGPCNAGDKGSISGWKTKILRAMEQLNPHATAGGSVCCKKSLHDAMKTRCSLINK